jgi:hypothetical protein
MRTLSEKERSALLALRDGTAKPKHSTTLALLSAVTPYVETVSVFDSVKGPGIQFKITPKGRIECERKPS